jgi:3-deoxy-D-manno-octulosonic-acid transferase
MLLELYRGATRLGGPLIEAQLRRRVQRGKEDPLRWRERLGAVGLARPDGPLLWLHAASVGESRSLLPLIEALLAQRAALQVLVTTGTVTSAALMSGQLPARARHQFAPVDRPQAWRAFFEHWRPQLGVLVESELWPNLILEARARDLPLALVNGRISERSYRRWVLLPASAARLCGGFALCLAQSETDRARLAALGARQATTAGNLKYAAPPLPADRGARRTGRRHRRATGLARRQHPLRRGDPDPRVAPPPCGATAGSADDDRAARSGARQRPGRRYQAPRFSAGTALAGRAARCEL